MVAKAFPKTFLMRFFWFEKYLCLNFELVFVLIRSHHAIDLRCRGQKIHHFGGSQISLHRMWSLRSVRQVGPAGEGGEETSDVRVEQL